MLPGARGEAPLPELNWADRQELWDLMVKKESGMYSRQKAEHMLTRHPALQPKMRAILLGKNSSQHLLALFYQVIGSRGSIFIESGRTYENESGRPLNPDLDPDPSCFLVLPGINTYQIIL